MITKRFNLSFLIICVASITLLCSTSSWANDMGFLKKLFGKDSKQNHSQSKTVEEMRADPNLIQIYDEYGREMFIDKETWRKDVLPGTITENWNKPDELYGVIVGALNDGFYQDVIKAAKHLYQIDPIPVRGYCILGIVMMKNGKLDEAENILNSYTEKFGEEGVVVTNIAKVQAERGQPDIAEKTLWHALELDPNQDNAVEWWSAIHHERSGKEGYVAALEKVAELNGSWRAQLWLARVALENQDYKMAREFHNVVISTLQTLPSEVMMQISGDLGNAGRISDIVELFGKRFDPEQHGLMVGNNLIKAYIELNDLNNARQVIAKLYELNRPDWKEHLKFWEEQIDQASGRYGPLNGEPKISITTLSLIWPIWAHKLSSLDTLLPKKKDDAPTVSFISSSCEYADMSEKPVQQKTDKEGTLSRAIPLFLTEQVQMTTSAKAVMLTPVIAGDGSFVLSAKPWPQDSLLEMARGSNVDYILSGHLVAHGTMWDFQATLVNVKEATVVEKFSQSIDAHNPAKNVRKLSERVKELLSQHCNVITLKPPIKYQLPQKEIFNMYLDGISQSLALSVATANESDGNQLYGERSMFDYLLNLALDDTNSDISRLMFVSALAKNKAYGSNIYPDYRKKVEKLLRDHPLSGVAAVVAEKTLAELYPKDHKSEKAQQ